MNQENLLRTQFEEKRKLQNTILELEKKIVELKNICFDYSAAMYEILGEFEDAANISTFQKIALKKLKDIADKNIFDEEYKKYLQQKYIKKNSDFIFELIDKALVKNVSVFIENTLSESFPKDDTDTLIIKEE